MRPLEVIIIALAAAFLMVRLFSKREEWLLLPVINALLTVAHLAGEGYRWQMVPVYVVVLAQVVWASLPLLTPVTASRGLQTVGTGLGALLIALGAAASVVMPVFRMPEPPGPYDVGTAIYHWVDEGRTEAYGEDPGGPREIMVQVWYPADAPGEPAPWLEHPRLVGRQMAQWVSFPPFITGHFNLIPTHASYDAPSADGPFPVIVVVHGWGGLRNINQDQNEALASQGYVVVSADHTYGALMTVFPDGRAAPNDPDAIPSREAVGEAAYQAAINQLVRTYAADTRFMLDQMEAGALPFPLDLERVGFFGHSTGGGAVIEACADEPRCDAVLGQDAWVIPISQAVVEGPGPQPVLLVNSETWTTEENHARQLRILDNSGGELVTIEGTAHYDFTIVPLLSPFAPALGLKGPLDGERVSAINIALLTRFFDEHLLGEDAPPVDTFPEVIRER